MTNYLIEFALIHLLLFFVYKLLLSHETQLAFRRTYLLASTTLATIIPFVQLPNLTAINNIDLTASVSAYVLPEIAIGMPTTEQSWLASLSWQNWLFLAITLLVAIRFIIALARILVFLYKSEAVTSYGRSIRHLPGLETSFTFFKWIFIDKNGFDDARDIIRHEEAHIKYGHSFDLLFLNLLTIPFWWVPSIWLTIRELKQIHEYQADRYALGSIAYKNYLNTLIGHSLKQEGLILTNSFNDTPLTKRLQFMKQLKKKISPWKAGSVFTILALTFYIFSCQTQNLTDVTDHVDAQLENETFQIVENPASFDGGIEAFYKYVSENLKYPDKARENKVSGKLFIEFVVEEDGTISNTKILRGIGYGFDEEALRVLENSPPWNPGQQKGHIVRQRMVLPITFKHPDTPVDQEIPSTNPPIKIFREGSTAYVEGRTEKMPNYPGGMTEFYQYVENSIQYPKEAQEMGIEGKVFVEFKVNTDGHISDVAIKRGIHLACDQEAKRIIESSKNWIPMEIDGEPVAITLVIPISFRLPKE